MPFRFILLYFIQNLSKERLRNVWNCEQTLTMIIWIVFRPDALYNQNGIWALKSHYLPSSVSFFLYVSFSFFIFFLSLSFLIGYPIWPAQLAEHQKAIIVVRLFACFFLSCFLSYFVSFLPSFLPSLLPPSLPSSLPSFRPSYVYLFSSPSFFSFDVHAAVFI